MFLKSFRFALFLFILGVSSGVMLYGNQAHSYSEILTQGYEDKYYLYNEGPGAESRSKDGRVGYNSYVYEIPTKKALAYTYWTLGFYNLEDDVAVDGFTRLNECEIYRNYHTNELEWRDIRNATRKFISENKTDFPTRFEFMMPIQLSSYDAKRGGFELEEDNKLDSLRRFEFYASDAFTEICNHAVSQGYPGSLIIEFSRPFTLSHVEMSKEEADRYTSYIYKKFIDRFDVTNRKQKFLQEMHVAYLVFKVKFFTYGKYLGLNYRLVPTIQMMAVMEGYEIYRDPAKEYLLFSQSFIANKKTGKLTVRLKEQYEILKQKSKDGVVLN